MPPIKLKDVAFCAVIINLVMPKYYKLGRNKDQNKTIPAAAIKTLFSAIL